MKKWITLLMMMVLGCGKTFCGTDQRVNAADTGRSVISGDSIKRLVSRGIARRDSGDFSGAIALFSLAIDLAPQTTSAYLNRAFCRVKLLDYRGAIDDYTEALLISKSWEESLEAYYNRGLTEALLADFKTAMSDFNYAIKLDPEYADAYYNRSILRGRMGDVTGQM